MTVIAVRDGIMAADTAVWQGNIIVGHVRKIERLNDGRLFAAAGDSGPCRACRDWQNGNAEKPASEGEGNFGALILAPDGVWRIDRRMDVHRNHDADFAVIGAHHELMTGAMLMGATAEQAVRLAVKYGDSAGGFVQVERLAPVALAAE